MLTGFEEITKPLTEQEALLLPVIAQGLRLRVGKSAAITNKAIVSAMWRNFGQKISEARVRKIVNGIRCSGMVPCLIATSNGYYVAENAQELLEYEESLRGREEAIREVRENIRMQRIATYGV